MNEIIYTSPLGQMVISATDQGLTGINYVKPEDDRGSQSSGRISNPHLEQTRAELDQYFKGGLAAFTIQLAPEGTPFQQKVWRALSQIPYGVTVSYGHIAEQIESPKAYQAVGMANHRNPISIIIPCHRVIGNDGKLIGYGGGIWRKEWLLKHEGILL